MDTVGTLQIGVDLTVLGQTKSYTGVANIVVETGNGIGKVRLYSDNVDKTKLNVTREAIGTIPQYKIDYGTGKDNLSMTTTVPTNQITVQNLTIGDTYYFQITPLDSSGNPSGTPSEITQATAGDVISCVVVGIIVSTQQIGEKYYLVRSGVENIDKYVVYRSDFETDDINQMQKVGETTGTMFEYPFDKSAKKNGYSYYLVEGICKDGTTLKMDSVKRIQTGPAENIVLIILISLFAYTIYKLYGYSKN